MFDCIEWPGYRNEDGYGIVGAYRDGKNWKAHRAAWVDAHGEIPDGLKVLHRCDNPPCINVEHLFLGTQHDNVLDMTAKGRHYNQQKDVCIHGHEFTPENTYVTPVGKRVCRECGRRSWREWNARRAEPWRGSKRVVK